MKKVCHISTAHNENDSRILLKQCQSLSKAGFEVYLIVTSDNEKKLYGTNIIPLSKSTSRMHRIFTKRKEAYLKALEVDADIYHFHDPELISIGKKLKSKGKKVIYDVHEDMSKQILNKTYLGPLFTRKIVAKAFDINEKKSAKKFNAVVASIDEIANKFDNKNSIAIKNYAIKDIIDEAEILDRKESKEKLVIIYVGSITKIRGIKEIIKSIEVFEGKVELWILGTFESEALHEECKMIYGYKYCKYFGTLLLKDVYKYIKSADLGICTLYPTENYKESIPIKVLEYMACSIPIILSDFKYWKDMFGDVGIYVNPLDTTEISSAINTFLNDKSMIVNIGKENRKQFLEKFSWDVEEKKLINLYNKL